jgi:hypothetical protein
MLLMSLIRLTVRSILIALEFRHDLTMTRTDLRRRAPAALLAFGMLAIAAGCNSFAGPSAAQTSPSEIGAIATASASAAASEPSFDPEPTEFVPPSPVCPSPPRAPVVPKVVASIGNRPGVVATAGSSTLTTCTTTATNDVASIDPNEILIAHAGEKLRLALPVGWRFLRSQGFDTPVAGEGANVWLPIDTPDRPQQIDLQLPMRGGDSIIGYDLWIVSIDGRVVGQIGVEVRVRIG